MSDISAFSDTRVICAASIPYSVTVRAQRSSQDPNVPLYAVVDHPRFGPTEIEHIIAPILQQLTNRHCWSPVQSVRFNDNGSWSDPHILKDCNFRAFAVQLENVAPRQVGRVDDDA